MPFTIRLIHHHHHHHHFYFPQPVSSPVDLGPLEERMQEMNAAFNRLSTAVAALSSVEAGVKTTVQHLADQVRALADAPTSDQLNALADQLEQTKDQIAADIVTGTDAQGEEPAEPVVVPVTDPTDVDPSA